MVLSDAAGARRSGGPGISGTAAYSSEDRRALRHGGRAGQLGRPADRHDRQGLFQGRADPGGPGRQREERAHIRQVPQPADPAGDRRAGRRGGLRQPGAGQVRAQVYEHPRNPYIQQAPGAVRPEPGQKDQAAQYHPVRGQPGRGDPAPGGVRQRRGVHGHGADVGADPAAVPVYQGAGAVLRQR